MTHRVTIYNRFSAFFITLLLCLLAACSPQEEAQVGGGRVDVKVMASASTMMAGAESPEVLPDAEKNIYDLSVFLFAKNGNLLHSKTEQFTNDPAAKKTVRLETFQATGCTVVVLANAIKSGAKVEDFYQIRTLEQFRKKFHTFKYRLKSESPECLLMLGTKENYNTQEKNLDMKLTRLQSKLTFKLTVNNDRTSGFPITIDSYQLMNVPEQVLYMQNFNSPQMPVGATFAPYPAVQNPADDKLTYTCYMPLNNEVEDKATYLKIFAHCGTEDGTRIWNSEFRIPILDSKANRNFKWVLPNYRYQINITITGNSTSTGGGVIIDSEVLPYFKITLAPWGNPQDVEINLP